MSILFVNGSPNRDGNTAALAKTLIGGRPYTTLNLNDYRINFYGQELSGDQFDEVAAAMRGADTLVIGSPLYWHNLSGALRTLLDHFYGGADTAAFSGKDMYFICQGAAPEQWSISSLPIQIQEKYIVYSGMKAMQKLTCEAILSMASPVRKSPARRTTACGIS